MARLELRMLLEVADKCVYGAWVAIVMVHVECEIRDGLIRHHEPKADEVGEWRCPCLAIQPEGDRTKREPGWYEVEKGGGYRKLRRSHVPKDCSHAC